MMNGCVQSLFAMFLKTLEMVIASVVRLVFVLFSDASGDSNRSVEFQGLSF
jgi:hypothetical protein